MKLTSAIFILTVLLLCSCGGEGASSPNPFVLNENTDTLSKEPVDIVRIDKFIAGYDNANGSENSVFMTDNGELMWGYGKFVADVDSVDNRTLSEGSSSRVTAMFQPQVDSVFTDLESERNAFGRLLALSRHNRLELPPIKFATVVWGSPRSIVVMDTINAVYIALNHYLGANHPAYDGWPDYQRVLKTRRQIPVDVAEALLAVNYPYNPGENTTVLSRLLYEGGLAMAKQALVPDASLESILGLGAEALEESSRHEAFIWKQLLQENKLYSTDSELMSNLFDSRPASTRISPDAPGRAVRYTAYRLVASYLQNNPDTELKFLLSPEFYNGGVEVLRASGYAPAEH